MQFSLKLELENITVSEGYIEAFIKSDVKGNDSRIPWFLGNVWSTERVGQLTVFCRLAELHL